MNTKFKIFMGFALVLSFVFMCLYIFINGNNKTYDIYKVTNVFNKDYPGRGLDLYTNKIQDHAMAYGLYASTAAMLGLKDESKKASKWLVENADHKVSYGWGLPFAWDAFNDGSVNPVETVYGITTAIAVRGLLDMYVTFGGEEFAECAIRALDYYSKYFTKTPQGGYFWYSDQEQDNKDVNNVSSMLMGQYARAASLFARDDFFYISQKAFKHLWSKRLKTDYGTKWTYGNYSDKPNDSVHAAYIVQGIIDYSRHSGEKIDLMDSVKYLKGFIHSDYVSEFNSNDNISEALLKRPARGWGIGMLIYTLADFGDKLIAKKITRSLIGYEFMPNKFSVVPGGKIYTPRTQSHISLGLARLQTS